MRAQQERRGCRILVAREPRNQIYKVNFASRRVVSKRLACYLPARITELLLDVISGFPACIRATGVRPQINKPLNVRKSFLSRQLLPDLCLRRACQADIKKQYEKQNGREL